MAQYLNETHFVPEELLDSDHLRRLCSKAITDKIWLGFRLDDPEKTRGKCWRIIGYGPQEEALKKLLKDTAK